MTEMSHSYINECSVHLLISHQIQHNHSTASQQHYHNSTQPIQQLVTATMHLNNALLISLLPALGMATSYRKKGSQDALGGSLMSTNGNAGNAAGINDCGISSFIGLSQNPENNPTVQDCKDMLLQPDVANDNEWTVTSTNQIIVRYKTCAFFSLPLPLPLIDAND